MKKIYRAIIADDEPLARQRLRGLLASFDNTVDIIAEAEDGTQALEMIDSLRPDLLFLDIQMPGKTGFEVLQNVNHLPTVIFCTAYDQYALEAFETPSIDYLVKPIKVERLQKSINKLELLMNNDHSQSNKLTSEENARETMLSVLDEYMKAKPARSITSIPVRLRDRMIFVSMDQIAWFEASDKYVNLHTRDGQKYLLEQSLNYLQEKLDDRFLRVQRGCIVNKDMIIEIKKYMGGKYLLKMCDTQMSHITTGRSYQEVIKGLMTL